jgi:predicted small integral membrane protein
MATLFVSVAAASIVLAAIGLVPRNWWWSGKVVGG